MGLTKLALLSVLLYGVSSSFLANAELEGEEDPFDFDAEDEGVELDESDSGYGQKPLTKVRNPSINPFPLHGLRVPGLAAPGLPFPPAASARAAMVRSPTPAFSSASRIQSLPDEPSFLPCLPFPSPVRCWRSCLKQGALHHKGMAADAGRWAGYIYA